MSLFAVLLIVFVSVYTIIKFYKTNDNKKDKKNILEILGDKNYKKRDQIAKNRKKSKK